MTLRVNEIYASIQGEGPNVGRPTIFLRFVGCNFKCPLWPCDSQHAIDPKLYRKDMKEYTPLKLAFDVEEQWFPGANICLTGGETLLQPYENLYDLVSHLETHTAGLADLELFTNGSFPIPSWMRKAIGTIVLDWKLPGSGESYTTTQENNVRRNLELLRPPGDAIKFTVASKEDFEEAVARWKLLIQNFQHAFTPPVYVGAVWGKVKEAEVAAWLLEYELPWYLNLQSHKFIWDPEARRT